MTETIPTPGSREAVHQGCQCAVMDNHHGKGFPWGGTTSFWITQGCPLHAPEPKPKDEEKKP